MRSIAQVIGCACLILAASHASAAVINLEPPTGAAGQALGYIYSQDGYTFSNNNQQSNTYFNWQSYGGTDYDADSPGSTLDVNFPDTTNTITKTSGGAFFFGGISLTNVFNASNVGGIVDFTFNYADGSSKTDTVTLALRSGLQAFAFNQANVTSVVIGTDPSNNSNSHYLQFDYLVADSVSAVPLPASLPMFGAALLALGGVGYGVKRKKAAANA